MRMRWVWGLASVAIAGGCGSGGGAAPPRAEKPPSQAEPRNEAPPSAVVPAPEPAAVAKPEPAPVTGAAPGADPSWWIGAPERAGGRLRVAAKADADSLIDARRNAVRAGTEALKAASGAEPAQVQTEKVDMAHLDDGRWRVFVLMSSSEPR